jgi:hypothetical protein
MTNHVTIRKDYTALEAYAASQAAQAVEGDLLLYKKGKYSAGADKTPVPIGTRLLVNIDSLSTGWVKWLASQPVEYRIWPVNERALPITREQLGDLDQDTWEADERGGPKDPWSRTMRVIMRAADGDIFTFASSSVFGRAALDKLAKAFGLVWREHPGEFPVIELSTGIHQHRTYGEIDKPVFPIVGWGSWDKPQAAPKAKPKGQKAIADAARAATAADLDDEIPTWN